ncbi:ribosomal L28 family-domain-containing protein [Endogone sp. FLAS-F59071]|nr:ribosomal L28 family-domain-containing protein [Endogone sp. FLAS-F59071]|eukprot:RUS18148.1 ribosomal L28 family-domain-containing protein [Endogone sp. FLAS-F59071]
MLSTRPFYELARATFKRADHGLFGGKHIQFGNNNPFSKKKTRRTWLPNVQHKKIYSEIFGQFFHLRVTTSVLRTIDKKGGLDRYLLETSEKNLSGKLAVQMRRNLEAKLERNNLGLPAVEMDGEEELVAKDEKEELVAKDEKEELVAKDEKEAEGLVLINSAESNELALTNEEEEEEENEEEAKDPRRRIKRVKSKKGVNKKKAKHK